MTTPRTETPPRPAVRLARPSPTWLLAAVLLAVVPGFSGSASLQSPVPPTRPHLAVPYQFG